jgi:hypothetical protein
VKFLLEVLDAAEEKIIKKRNEKCTQNTCKSFEEI